MAEDPRHVAERRWLWFSMSGSFLMALVGLVFASLAKSNAVLLDGVYSLISFIMAFVTSRIAHVVNRPETATFHFGYSAFEPFVNALRGTIVFIVLIYAFMSALNAMLSGGREISTGIALAYAVTAGSLCLVISAVQKNSSRRLSSSFLKIDSDTWFADGMISLGVGFAFLVGYLMEWFQWTRYINYVDPAIVMGMVLYIGRDPVATVRENVGELLQIAPGVEIQQRVQALVNDGVAALKPAATTVRMLKIGQYFYVKVSCVMTDPDQSFSVTQLVAVRDALETQLRSEFPNARVDLGFESAALQDGR